MQKQNPPRSRLSASFCFCLVPHQKLFAFCLFFFSSSISFLVCVFLSLSFLSYVKAVRYSTVVQCVHCTRECILRCGAGGELRPHSAHQAECLSLCPGLPCPVSPLSVCLLPRLSLSVPFPNLSLPWRQGHLVLPTRQLDPSRKSPPSLSTQGCTLTQLQQPGPLSPRTRTCTRLHTRAPSPSRTQPGLLQPGMSAGWRDRKPVCEPEAGREGGRGEGPGWCSLWLRKQKLEGPQPDLFTHQEIGKLQGF